MPNETPPYIPASEAERDKYAREEDKQKLKAKLARPNKANPEVLAVVKELDKKQLEALRATLADVEAPKKFPEGTEEIELAEEDIEETK